MRNRQHYIQEAKFNSDIPDSVDGVASNYSGSFSEESGNGFCLDEKLIEGLNQGNEEAFSLLVEKYRARVVNTCFGFVRHEQDAEDVAQNVFLEVFRSISEFNGNVALWVWLYRLSTQKSIDFIRTKTRKKRFAEIRSLFYNDGSPIPVASGIISSDNIEQQELSEILKKVISKLPQRQQKAFVLSRNEGLSNREVGKVLSVSESAVESLITRANKQLRKLLHDYYKAYF
ncbi:RNA polymerase sigma factor [Marinilabilia rubra]|uniref:RNA polymerase sigma factor n=1 Tax=Marinilabilia rubra TaxID=2162893 RepID=UPI001304EA34|nr:RNA polymerase sigma factor [Marinilabilia rubra]